MNKSTVLILGTHDACRTQIAAGFMRQTAGDRLEVFTAGIQPAAEVHPLAIKIMAEIAIDISAQKPTAASQYLGQRDIDYLITVSPDAESHIPPSPPRVGQRLHWPFDDPAAVTGNELEKIRGFRCIRNEIAYQVKTWALALR